MGVSSGTSFREQVLFFYIQKLFPDALNRYKHESIGELDIFVPSENIGIEYDGGYWHKKKIEIDNEKNLRAKVNGVRLIRIREHNLPVTENAFGEIHLDKNSGNSYDIQYLNHIFSELGKILNYSWVKAFLITEESYKYDLPKIYSRIYCEEIAPNLTDICGIELWDKDYNGELTPVNIPKNEWAYALLKCPARKPMLLPRYHRNYKTDCKTDRKQGCNNCVGYLVCPIIKWCHALDSEKEEIFNCEYAEKRIRVLLEEGVNYHNLEQSYQIDDWLWAKSDLGIRIVKEILLIPKGDCRREKYFKFLGYKYKKDGMGFTCTTVFVRNDEEKKIVEKFASQLEFVKLCVSIFPSIMYKRAGIPK